MIVSFGHICMDIQTNITSPLKPEACHNSTQNIIEIGGASALQAIAAARCGAKTALRGKIGNDLFSDQILTILRREGIQHNALIREDSPTPIATTIAYPSHLPTTIKPSKLTLDNPDDLIPDTSLHARTLLLLNHETPADILDSLLTRAQNSEAKSILCIEHKDTLPFELISKADLVIFGFPTDDKADLPESYILYDREGLRSCFIGKANTQVNLTSNKHTEQNTLHPSGTFDIFCGFVASCLQAGLTIEKAADYGLHAAHIAAQTSGTYRAMPYLDDVRKEMEHVDNKKYA